MRIYECGICNYLHPWDWAGDCRDDTNRFAAPDDYAKRRNVDLESVEVFSWEERQEVDQEGKSTNEQR